MRNQLITTKQSISILILFLIGTSLVLTPGAESKQDVWITILISMVMTLPIYFIYARILYLFPNKDLYMIIFDLFGSVFGSIITIFYIWYSIHLGALVLRNFSEFIQIVSFLNTPQIVIIVAMCITCIIFCKKDIEAIGQWSSFMLPIILTIFLFTLLFSIPQMNIDNLRPILFEGIKPVIDDAFTVLAFPFAEVVLFLGVFNTLKEKKNIYKVFFTGLLISGLVGIAANLRNILTLGVDLTLILYFPSYTSVKLINIGDFIERTEVTVAIILLLSGLIKICICIIVASKGIVNIFSLSDNKSIITPVTLVMMSLASLIYTNVIEMFDWAINIYRYYAIPFQIIIPLLIYGAVELKVRRVLN